MARQSNLAQGANSGSNDVPSVRDYEEAREHSIKVWIPVVWSALAALRRAQGNEVDDLELFVAETQFKALADRALWAVTEISPAWRWKYAAQRYVSRGVIQQWNLTPQSPQQCPSSWPVTDLRHEHVFERKALRKTLREASDEVAVRATLSGAVSCVVTVQEDNRLNRGKLGWERYKYAQNGRVEVFDRLSSCWM